MQIKNVGIMFIREAFSLIGPYFRKRVNEQLKSVIFIISYMIAFQTLILGTPIQNSITIATGLTLVVLGLTFFMEGLVLGLMPLGENIGLKLPQKAPLFFVLLFALILGIAATFAEPAIGVLRAAGQDVKPWEAPLLYRLLNVETDWLVYSVAIGVGFAVVFGVLRFMYQLSLKPFLIVIVGALAGLTIYASFSPKLTTILGLAWDCGAVTTGPVTVPLVLALGIGICRVSSSDHTEMGGFGIVTLASLFPIIAVLSLAISLESSTPHSMSKEDFLNTANKSNVIRIFKSESDYNSFLEETAPQDTSTMADKSQQAEAHVGQSIVSAIQAIIPLCLGLLLCIWLLREKLTKADEIFLGIFLAVAGMAVFNIGIEIGLANLGKQVGKVLPSSYEELPLSEKTEIPEFTRDNVRVAVSDDGTTQEFFYHWDGKTIRPHLFREVNLDQKTNTYSLQKTIGPIFGEKGSRLGIFIVLLFAFLMGFGATLAEPALNALGSTVETLTAGSFKKRLLMQSVAVGVGLGLTVGIAKIIWNIPLGYLILLPYMMLLILTYFSSEELVNIAWDSAGVTTGPITVPLVIAMGLGISSQSPVIEGFGILAMASVGPILIVLSIGLIIQAKHKSISQSSYLGQSDRKAHPDVKESIEKSAS